MKVALIPCGATDWRQEGRLLGRVALSFAGDGDVQCSEWGEELRPAALSRIFHAPDELSKTTAQQIARRLNLPTKTLDDLDEVDLGLWTGLTEAELKKRYAKAHRLLLESPLNVTPPQGENFADAVDRLRACLKKRIKANGKAGIGLVMRPFAFAMARHVLEGRQPDELWEESQHEDRPVVMDCSGVPAPANET
jgi:probable phosphoglycerate mutase